MTELGPEKARQICEGFLDITGRALLSSDFEPFAACFHLPHTVETPDRKTVLKTRAALKSMFDRVCEYYQSHNVTDLVRIIETAEFRGPNRIEALRTTHLMSGNHRIKDPFPSYSVLEKIGDDWLLISTQYAVDRDTTIGRALHVGGPEISDSDTSSRQGKPTRKETKE